jgi:hypothetical protein
MQWPIWVFFYPKETVMYASAVYRDEICEKLKDQGIAKVIFELVSCAKGSNNELMPIGIEYRNSVGMPHSPHRKLKREVHQYLIDSGSAEVNYGQGTFILDVEMGVFYKRMFTQYREVNVTQC